MINSLIKYIFFYSLLSKIILFIYPVSIAYGTYYYSINCDLGADDLDFGNINILDNLDETLTNNISVTCSVTGGNNQRQTVSYVIKFGCGSSNNCLIRRMNKTPDYINYNIYNSSAYTRILADGTGGTRTLTRSYLLKEGDGARTDYFTLYLKAPAVTNKPAGLYVDTITLKLQYNNGV